MSEKNTGSPSYQSLTESDRAILREIVRTAVREVLEDTLPQYGLNGDPKEQMRDFAYLRELRLSSEEWVKIRRQAVVTAVVLIIVGAISATTNFVLNLLGR